MKSTLKIAHLEVEAPVMLAPLAGVSDAPFRLLCREQGAAWVCSELVSSDGLIRGSQRTLEYLYFFPEERPVGVQLFGSDPGVMAEAARYVSARPPELRPDFIDLNIGCPVHKVVTREAGAALLCNVPLLEAMVKAVVAASTLPVTAKTRCGWDNDHRNGVEVAQRLEQCGVAMIAIHARTRAQKFEGKADWNVIREAKEKVSIPLVGNGDVFSAAAARQMLEETGCDAVMIGRGALADPWIFRAIRAAQRGETFASPDAVARLQWIELYAARMQERGATAAQALGRAKQALKAAVTGGRLPAATLTAALRARSLEEFADCAADRAA